MAILIVEDEPDLSDLLSYILRRAGHDVIVAFDGEAALRLWKERNPELVLLDLGIPKTDGWDVCRLIRSQSATPVMMRAATRPMRRPSTGTITRRISPQVTTDLPESQTMRSTAGTFLRARIRSPHALWDCSFWSSLIVPASGKVFALPSCDRAYGAVFAGRKGTHFDADSGRGCCSVNPV